MREAYEQASPLRVRAKELGVLFVVNDRCDLAMALEADGVHLGEGDMPYQHARHLLGRERCIGLSTHNAGQVAAANRLGPDYIGFGPIFTPVSKPDHQPVVGIDGLKEIRPLTSLPLFAIGGIRVEHVRPLLEAGADGVAVISAVVGAADVKTAAARFTEQML
jgi:thiamine-phosphate pyrophosphorylase